MRVTIEVVADGAQRPPTGAVVVAEVRDTSLQDALATTLARGDAIVAAAGSLAEIGLNFEASAGADVTAFAHVDVDGDGRVSEGDWLSVTAVPVRAIRTRVAVVRI